MARLRVGLSGYSYKEWRGEGRFYPTELKESGFLLFYSQRYNAVEMDGTWYRMPSENAVQSWLSGSPEDFTFTFKAHRSITHVKRLQEETLESVKFLKGRLDPIKVAGKLGCVFFQLPPSFKRNDERLHTFLGGLPPGPNYGVEFRHNSWHNDHTEAIMREHQAAWVTWDTPEEEGQRRDTGKCVYARMRKQEYGKEDLKPWQDWFQRALDQGKDCLVFFKHEDEGEPWVFADRLLEMMEA